MTHVQVQGEIGAGVDTVWGIVGDFGGMVSALGAPVETEGDGIGMLRTIRTRSHVIVERLEELDGERKLITYEIVQPGPLPVKGYRATMQLAPSGADDCMLTWFSDFEPDGASEEDATKAVQGIYDGGIAGLRKYFAR
jgi:Polyketide cyclase / dehydrase and lipid transport